MHLAMADASHSPRSNSSGSSEAGWGDLLTQEMSNQDAMNSQILAVDLYSPEKDGIVVEEGEDEEDASTTYADVRQRLDRFEATQKMESGQPMDDPYWLEPFMAITETIEVPPHVNNFQTNLRLLSGCTGLCAEGWVLKARVVFKLICMRCFVRLMWCDSSSSQSSHHTFVGLQYCYVYVTMQSLYHVPYTVHCTLTVLMLTMICFG